MSTCSIKGVVTPPMATPEGKRTENVFDAAYKGATEKLPGLRAGQVQFPLSGAPRWQSVPRLSLKESMNMSLLGRFVDFKYSRIQEFKRSRTHRSLRARPRPNTADQGNTAGVDRRYLPTPMRTAKRQEA